MVVCMKKAMFRYKMSLAGYSDYDIERIEDWLDSRVPACISDERVAIHEYAKMNTDASKIPLYINTVTHMYLNSGLEFHEAAVWVSRTIAGWCK